MVIVVLLGVCGLVVIGRLISVTANIDGENKEREGMIEMRDMSAQNEEYAEVPGRILLPQGC